MYLAGVRWFGDAPSVWQRPWQSAGALGLGVVALLLTYDWPWKEINYQDWRQNWTSGSALIVGNALAALLPIAAVCVAAREVRASRWTELDRVMVGLAPLCGVVGYSFNSTAVAQALFNGYLFALGLGALVAGIRWNKLGRVNAGLLALSALIVARFFDSDLSFLARGLAFILLGAGFLATNVVMLLRKGAAAA